jgi:hypothetical protein
MPRTVQVEVCLNGTNENPYHQYHLSQNPFPQFAVYPYDAACLRLQALGGDPIPNTDYIRQTLAGFEASFVEGICRRFEPGKYVRFYITFPWDD